MQAACYPTWAPEWPRHAGPAFAPGAIPTVDFLLHHFGAGVKKMPVKTHDRLHAARRATYSAERLFGEALPKQGFTPKRTPTRRSFSAACSRRDCTRIRRVATRYDKLAANYLAMIQLASMRLWLRAYESTA